MNKLIFLSCFVLILGCSASTNNSCKTEYEVNKNMLKNSKWIEIPGKEKSSIIEVNITQTRELTKGLFEVWYRCNFKERYFDGYKRGFDDYSILLDCRNSRHSNLKRFIYDENSRLLKKIISPPYTKIEDIPVKTVFGGDVKPIYYYICKEQKSVEN